MTTRYRTQRYDAQSLKQIESGVMNDAGAILLAIGIMLALFAGGSPGAFVLTLVFYIAGAIMFLRGRRIRKGMK